MCLSKQVRSNARAGPSIVWIDIDGDHEAWKIHTVHAARLRYRDMSALFVCGIHLICARFCEMSKVASTNTFNVAFSKPIVEIASEDWRCGWMGLS